MSLVNVFQLSNYWWILIWPVAVGIFFCFVKHLRTESVLGRRENRWQPWAAVLLVLPLTLWAGFRGYVGDTYAYRQMFLDMPSEMSGWSDYLADATKDKGFYAFSLLIKSVIGSRPAVYLLILAVIQMLCLACVLRKYSCNYWLSIFLFVTSVDYISWMYNGIRQFLAVTIIFASLTLILKKRFIAVIVIILLTSLIHQSALLMLPVLFIIQGKAFNKVTIICIILAVFALAFADQFTDVLDTLMSDTQYADSVTEWTINDDDGMNPIRAVVYAVPMILALIGLHIIREENDPLINLCVNASIITTALSVVAVGTSGIFIGRLPVYTSLFSTEILLPWELEHLFETRSARIMKILAAVFYTIFFYYQMHFTWGIL